MATSSSSATKVSNIPQGSEPTFTELFDVLADQRILPSEYLLSPKNNFINKQRQNFLNASKGFLMPHIHFILEGLNFQSAPDEIKTHFLYPEGPIAIFVGGSSMNIFEGITVPSTDIDIDLLPLVEKSGNSKSGSAKSKIIPIYTDDKKLTPLYQQYFDWLLNTMATAIDTKPLILPSMTDMISKNLNANVEVRRAQQYNKKIQSIPGEVLNIRVAGERKYILAEIINENFFSKVAVWIRDGDELERIIEFKLLKQIPNLQKYHEVTSSGIWAPTRSKYVENAIETLSYRMDVFQKEIKYYNDIFRSIYILPETYLLDTEESLRKKLLISKMRINDLFERIYQLLLGMESRLQENEQALISFYTMLINKENQNYFNPVSFLNLNSIRMEKIPNFGMLHYLPALQHQIYQKLEVLSRQVNEYMNAIMGNTIQILRKSNVLDKDDVVIPKEQLDKIRSQINELESLRKKARNRSAETRLLNLKSTVKAEEAVKVEETVGIPTGENELAVEVTKANKAVVQEAREDKNRSSPLSRESQSPSLTNNSGQNLKEAEELQAARAQEAEELYLMFKNSEKNKPEEIEQKIKTVFEKQKEIRNEKRKRKQEIEEAQRKEAKARREQKRQKELEKTAAQEKQKALNEQLLEETLKQSEEEKAKLNKKTAFIKEYRKLFYFWEAPSYNPQSYYSDFYKTFAPVIFKDKPKELLYAYKFHDWPEAAQREQYPLVEPVPSATEMKKSDESENMAYLRKIVEVIFPPLFFTFLANKDSKKQNPLLEMNHLMNFNEQFRIATQSLEIVIRAISKDMFAELLQLQKNQNQENQQTKDKITKLESEIEKFRNTFMNPVTNLKSRYNAFTLVFVTLKSSINGGQKKVTFDEESLRIIYSETLHLAVELFRLIYVKLTSCKGEMIPTPPTEKDYTEVMDPISKLTLEAESKDKSNVQDRYVLHRKFMLLYKMIIMYYSVCTINELNDFKNRMYENASFIPPTIVLTTFPQYYKNPVKEYDASVGGQLDFHIFPGLYDILEKNYFTFVDEYPMTQRFISIYPPFKDTLEKIEAKLPIKVYPIKIKQNTEVNLHTSKELWEGYTNETNETNRKILIERFAIILELLSDNFFNLNSKEEWQTFDILIRTPIEVLTNGDLRIISAIKIDVWRSYFTILFVMSRIDIDKDFAYAIDFKKRHPELSNPKLLLTQEQEDNKMVIAKYQKRKIIVNMDIEQQKKAMKLDIDKRIADYLASKALQNSLTSQTTSSSGKKGGYLKQTKRKKRRNSKKTRKSSKQLRVYA